MGTKLEQRQRDRTQRRRNAWRRCDEDERARDGGRGLTGLSEATVV